ncbi:MAG: TatD family hydrolase [Eubacterium sp.]|nr:TatD family hydrolase [Eubacterium sp.]
MIFDTHAHYDDEAFADDRDELLAGLFSHGIDRVANIGVDIPSCVNTLELAQKYDFIYAVIGFHPSDILKMKGDELDWLRNTLGLNDVSDNNDRPEAIKQKKIVAVGEIGLDYHWSETDDEHEKQKEWFRAQIGIAGDAGLPIVIHSRDAAADTMDIVKETTGELLRGIRRRRHGMGASATEDGKIPAKVGSDNPASRVFGQSPGIVHCYSYSAEQALEYVKMGYCIGVGGVITFKNSRRLKETVDAVSMESIVLETDCPYLAPEGSRGKRNDSTKLHSVVREIAKIKGITEHEVIDITTENALRVYEVI